MSVERGKLEPLNPPTPSQQEKLSAFELCMFGSVLAILFACLSPFCALLHLALCPQEADFCGLHLLGSLAL